MRRTGALENSLTAALGALTVAGLAAAYVVFERLRVKMVRFDPLTVGEESLVNIVGVALLVALLFFLLALARIVRHTMRTQRISWFQAALIGGGVLALLFVFADIALIDDIGSQYEAGLSQPEWPLLYFVIAFQAGMAAVLGYVSVFRLRANGESADAVHDNSSFVFVQVTGTICGLTGLSLMTLNLFYPRAAETVRAHAIMAATPLVLPYVLAVGWWLAVKLRERPRRWFDEKQGQDAMRAAAQTLAVSVPVMGLLYAFGDAAGRGMAGALWFPLYFFLVQFLFSALILYAGRVGLEANVPQ